MSIVVARTDGAVRTLRDAERPSQLLAFALRRRGMLTSNVAEATAFLRSRTELTAADLQFLFAPVMFLEHGFIAPPAHGISIGAVLLRPASEGAVTIRSSRAADAPRIDPAYLTDPSGTDLATLVAGVERALAVLRSGPLADHVTGLHQPAAPGRDEIERHVRERAESVYHPLGTCRMGIDPTDAVVGPDFRVHGLEGLWVADASVLPNAPRGNPAAPTMLAAHLAAEAIVEGCASAAPGAGARPMSAVGQLGDLGHGDAVGGSRPRRRGRRRALGPWIVVGIGATLVVGPLVGNGVGRAQAGERLVTQARPAVSRTGIVQLRADTDLVIATGGAILNEAIPALAARLGATPEAFGEVIRSRYPALAEANDRKTELGTALDGTVSNLERHVDDYAEADAIPLPGVPPVALPVGAMALGAALVVLGWWFRRTSGRSAALAVAAVGALMVAGPPRPACRRSPVRPPRCSGRSRRPRRTPGGRASSSSHPRGGLGGAHRPGARRGRGARRGPRPAGGAAARRHPGSAWPRRPRRRAGPHRARRRVPRAPTRRLRTRARRAVRRVLVGVRRRRWCGAGDRVGVGGQRPRPWRTMRAVASLRLRTPSFV